MLVLGIALIHLTMAAAPGRAIARAESTVVVERGTKIFAQIDRSLSTDSVSRGDRLSMHVAEPLVVGHRVVIPAGAVIEAVLEGVDASPRGEQRVELSMLLTSLRYPTGRDFDLQQLHAAAVLRGASEFYLGAGSTIEIVAQEAFAVDERLTVAATPESRRTSMIPPREQRKCWIGGTPGTPDIIIPGTPPTPAVGDIPGSPGTPDIIVPGTPATPPMLGPCP